MTEDDYAVVCAMIRYGGGFVVALAHAAQCADAENLARLKTAFAHYWRKYAELAAADKRSRR